MASVIQPVGGITVIVILLDNDDDGLGAMYYDVHVRLIEKRVVDFLLVLIEFFCSVLWLRCYEQK